MMSRMRSPLRLASIGVGAFVLAGCASLNIDESLDRTNRDAASFTQGKLKLNRSAEDRAAADEAATALLSQPLGQDEAVRLALVNSPALQALLAQRWANGSNAAQSGRIPNPVFGFGRLRTGDELELERVLAFGLLDLILLPQRYGIATRLIEQNQVQLTADVVDEVTKVRMAWVGAVAAQQGLQYAQQVFEGAEASAELARRMQAVGNFNRLDRARQQVFYADAATQLAQARHSAAAMREGLVRQLGLSDVQAERMKLPERLPDLPASPRDPADVGQAASQRRLDVQIARAGLEAAAKVQGITLVSSLTDIELALRRNTTFDDDTGSKSTGRGFEVAVRLPIFDWGGAQRDAMNAQTLAMSNRLEATMRAAGSSLRESYSAYRTTYDLARHYRDEVVPLRKLISEENVLRYNGMLIGVFELLADSRTQVTSVIAAIGTARQFWEADAALKASIVGQPTMGAVMAVGAAAGGGGDAPH